MILSCHNMKTQQWPLSADATSITTTRLLYGCMTIAGSWNRDPATADERKRAFEALDAAVEQGFTMFDHADIYCRGKSEQLFGEYLQEHPRLRSEILVQSKCGIRFPEKASDHPPWGLPIRYDFSREYILESVEGILRRLGIETLDVLLLHRPDPLVEPEEVAAAFDELRRSGKVREFGVSNHSAAQIQLLESVLDVPLVANQVEISLLHPDVFAAGTAVNQHRPEHVMRDKGIVEYCRSRGIQLQAWSPLAKGYLSGRNLREDAATELQDRVSAASRLVRKIANSHGVSLEAIVLGWILRHPAEVLPVVGTADPRRIARSAEADKVELSREEWYLLLEAARGMTMP